MPNITLPVAELGIHQWLVAQGLPVLEVTNIKDFDMLELWDDRCVSVVTNTGLPCSEYYSDVIENIEEEKNEER